MNFAIIAGVSVLSGLMWLMGYTSGYRDACTYALELEKLMKRDKKENNNE